MSNEPYDEDVCANRHGGNPESVAVFKAINRRGDQRMILRHLESCSGGLTCDELEEYLGMSHQTCSARCAELKRKGLIRPKPLGDSYERRPTRTGSMAAVLVLA